MDLSIVVPTFNEKENIQKLLEKIYDEFQKNDIDGEVIVVDDGSPDGTGRIVEGLKSRYTALQIIHRTGKLGLSSAVLAGFSNANSEILAVMDADLSHPPEKINEMYKIFRSREADLVIGSRYIKGGNIKGWGIYRKALSRGATLLARAFTNVKDPMTGFFMVKKECVKEKKLNPKGFKILLEIILKSDCKIIKEIPITFINRIEGKSKAGMGEILYYLSNLVGYLPYLRKSFREFIKFAFVGLIGTIVNLLVLYFLTEYGGIYYLFSAVLAFIVAATSNFILNKTWTFRERIGYRIVNKYMKFFSISVIALLVNLFFLYVFTEFLGIYYIVSQIIAIGISLVINFIGNKKWTFRK
jgi:dolichol-phosphate mannosyltransferase